jgi:hypothetical protein
MNIYAGRPKSVPMFCDPDERMRWVAVGNNEFWQHRQSEE